jgi:hypothetical protein
MRRPGAKTREIAFHFIAISGIFPTMSDEQIQAELVDEQIQAEPVFDEFILAKRTEAAEAEDRRIRAVTALQELRAEADERDRTQADARFAEARARYPNLTVHQVADLLGDPEAQFASAQHINAVET